MHSWSTDDIAERDRFAIWREWRAAQVFGLTAELERSERGAFSASIASRAIGTATVGELRSSAYFAARSCRDIGRVQADSLCIYQQLDGPQWASKDGLREPFVTPRSHIALGYSDLPYAAMPLSRDAFHTRLVIIPLTERLDPTGRRVDMATRVAVSAPGLPALFVDYARSFFENVGDLNDEAAQAAVETLGRLAFLAFGGGRRVEETEGGMAAVAAGQLQRVQAFIRDNLQRRLAPEVVAAALRISPRTLHRLFEPTGTTFARYVQQQRIERAAERLQRYPHASILDTALDCGFNGSSAFYRAFRNHYGATPSDVRATRRERAMK